MNDQPELPPLREGLLDSETLNNLFEDLRRCTRVLSVLPKSNVRGMVDVVPVSLEDGRRQFLERRVRGLQIRYHYQDFEWWDTLMWMGDKVKIVRIQHDFSELNRGG
jgi:hypothetical protein